ncbi:MAG: ATP-binding protein [Eubacterium sp.]|nr:ATP-binding protein [Eubacterium sp.]
MKFFKIATTIILIVVFGYILFGEILLPANTPMNGNICDVLPGDNWYEVKEDGTRVPFTVPGTTDGDITLETEIPRDFNPDYSVLCFRGMDMDIYVGGELREQIKTEDYAILGDQSAEAYVMASVYPKDAGKTLRVHYEYNAGMVYEVFIGTRLGIVTYMFDHYGFEFFVGLTILILGLICLIASFSYKLVHKKYLEMEHLSLGVILGACWVLSNSVFRQLYTSNMSVMSDIPFLMVMVMPLPFLYFVNSLQENRYCKLIQIAGTIDVLNFIVCGALFVIGWVPLTDSFISSALCALFSIVIMFITLIRDLKHHLIRSYRYVAVGFVVLAVAAVIQIGAYQFAHNGVFSGLFMAFGLFGFIICAIIHTIKQLIGIRVEANEAMHISQVKDDFLANMSHEIRTPLNGILGMDEMILRETRESVTRKHALEIKSAGDTLLSLINDILDLSKIESGNLELLPVDYDLASVLNDVLNMTRPRALKKGLNYSMIVDERIPAALHGDEIRVRQVILNIVNNAIKYTKKGHVDIEVSFRRRPDKSIELVVCVSDTGMGIREEDKSKLFKSFYRLEEKKNRHIEGTGLGLHITRRLLTMMDGRISFNSVFGRGSVFVITIPQMVVNPNPIGDFSKAVEAYLSQIETDDVTLYAPEARVLVVDDNEMNLDVIDGMIKDTRMKIDLIDSGKGAIELVEKQTYDLILLDQMMPELTGEETLKKMMEMDILKGTPVIALTADAIMGARESYLAMGFADYVSKPVKYKELEKVLRRFIPEEKQFAPETTRELPVALLWGYDSEVLREEKERLSGVYKCVPVVGKKAMEKYLEKHTPDRIIQIR